MNIFKILASGDGRLNEPNVSAFLAYILNPKEDHGLGDVFLKKILSQLDKSTENLKPLLDINDKIRDLSIRSSFEFEVIPEQAFEQEKGKQVVDIVLLCYKKVFSDKKESLAKHIIDADGKKGELKQIFLIENKIRDDSTTEKQLSEQYQQTINFLKPTYNKDNKTKDLESLVSVIFITPCGTNTKAEKEYKEFCKSYPNTNSKQIFWTPQIVNFLSDILKEELESRIEPIPDYSKQTLKAFINFVNNGFKSSIEEELENKSERPRFKYNNIEGYTRKGLAYQIIKDYIDEHKGITFEKLSKKFNCHSKKRPTILKEEDANKIFTKDYNWYFNTDKNPSIQINNDEKICIKDDWDDWEKIKKLLDCVDLKYIPIDNSNDRYEVILLEK